MYRDNAQRYCEPCIHLINHYGFEIHSGLLSERMKFFIKVIPKSSCPFPYWAYPCGVPDTPEQFRQLSYRYSMHHSRPPKSDGPNIFCSELEIPVARDGMSALSASSLKHLCSGTEDTQHAYEHVPCSQLLLKYEHFQNYISESTNHDNDTEGRPEEHRNDILSPIQYGNSNCLSNESSFGSWTFNKTKTFIETKVTAIKLQGFNL